MISSFGLKAHISGWVLCGKGVAAAIAPVPSAKTGYVSAPIVSAYAAQSSAVAGSPGPPS